MKLVLIILLVILCGAVGFGVSNTYKQHRNFFFTYLEFLEMLKSEIGFSANKLNDILKVSIENINNKDFVTLLKNYQLVINGKQELKRDELFKNIKILNEKEKNDIYSFFKNLGKTDVFNQVEIINGRMEVVKNYCQKLKSDCEKYCPLYTKLGILAGLFLALIII